MMVVVFNAGFDYKMTSKQFFEMIYTTLFTIYAKWKGARYLVFADDICSLGSVAIS
jgi:hypothetical protein